MERGSFETSPKRNGQSLARIVVLFSAFTLALITIGGSIAAYHISKNVIGGAEFNRIVDAKDAVADILPPPMFVVEPFVHANIAALNTSEASASIAEIKRLRGLFDESRKRWAESDLPPALKQAMVRDVGESAAAFWQILETEFLPAVSAGDRITASSALSALDNKFQAHRVHVVATTAKLIDYSNSVSESSATQVRILMVELLLLAVLLFAGIGAGAYALIRLTAVPLARLNLQLGRLASGDLDITLERKSFVREFSEIWACLGSFRANAVERARLEKETQASVASQAAAIAAIGQALKGISNGDMTTRIEEQLADSFERLQKDFNDAVAQIEETVAAVKAGTSAIGTGTAEISQAADDLSRRTENQAASLEETTAALAEINDAVRSSAETASDARSLAGTAKIEAEQSREIVDRAVDAMNGIEAASKEINQIIVVIDEIAFQTNLLALNAGVEAARAGEAGRGFAVVASEVRALAQRSADAAKQIKSLIAGSTSQVKRGVELVGETGTALLRIVQSVSEINEKITEIARRASEQATAVAEVNTAVSEMDRVTQQNAAMVEQTTAATRALAERSNEFSQLVGRFRTTDGGSVKSRVRTVPRTTTAPALADASFSRATHVAAVGR